MARGLVFNIQKYSIQDGPGIRTTVFLKGCPLHCAWCHNPESISVRREIVVLENRCLGCLQCRGACRYGMVIEGDGPLPARNAQCDTCGACVEACPTEARRMVGREMDVTEVMQAVLQDRYFYEASGGGVTFSGGEPLLQHEFLHAALQACRAEGIHTTVDTCGMAVKEDMLEIAEYTDLFLYDIKLAHAEKHRTYTGVGNERIVENLRALGERHNRIWARVPVIPGVNESSEEMRAIAELLQDVSGVRQVNLLPYHRAGEGKRAPGAATTTPHLEPPTPAVMERAITIFRAAGLVTKAGG